MPERAPSSLLTRDATAFSNWMGKMLIDVNLAVRNDSASSNITYRGMAVGRGMCYNVYDALLQRPDESSCGQMESALLSFSRHLAVVWLVLPSDHLGQIALSFKSNSFQLSPVCLLWYAWKTLFRYKS